MSAMEAEDKRGPGIRFPPPLLALAVIGGAWLIDRYAPLPITADASLQALGIALIALALLVALIALVQFSRSRTKVEPWHPTTTIIQHGLYRYSRNPIYLAFCVATLGAGLVFDSWWVLASAAPLMVLLQQLVIRREEAYLARKFGADYLDYQRRVRRWL